MKTVIFFRHGKSDWHVDYGHDHDRPLAKRGRRAARKMGRYLSSLSQVPDAIVSSTAERAQKTARLAAKSGDWNTPIRETRELYDASPSSIVDLIRQLPEGQATVMLVGHEPVWSMSVGVLTGSRPVRFPTAAMASIRFEVDRWDAIEPGGGVLQWLVVPKSLPDDE